LWEEAGQGRAEARLQRLHSWGPCEEDRAQGCEGGLQVWTRTGVVLDEAIPENQPLLPRGRENLLSVRRLEMFPGESGHAALKGR
jgi:hypothetical protein